MIFFSRWLEGRGRLKKIKIKGGGYTLSHQLGISPSGKFETVSRGIRCGTQKAEQLRTEQEENVGD